MIVDLLGYWLVLLIGFVIGMWLRPRVVEEDR
jgi:hypothetical protein